MLRTVETPERSATQAGGQTKRKDALSARAQAQITAPDARTTRRPLASRASSAGYRSPESLEHANQPSAPRPSARRLRYEGEGAASDVGHRYENEGATSGAGFSQTHDH